jgi:hypothetical protein
MFFNSSIFWFLMGVLFILVAAGFRAFAKDRGWVISWWKTVLALFWYAIFTLSFYAYGTLMGENEASAGSKILGLGLVISLVLGLIIWRLFVPKTYQIRE